MFIYVFYACLQCDDNSLTESTEQQSGIDDDADGDHVAHTTCIAIMFNLQSI